MVEPLDPEHRQTVRRILRTAVAASVLLSLGALPIGGWRLTGAIACSALLVVMNFIWLEEIVKDALRSPGNVNPAQVSARVLFRMIFLTASLFATVAIARFEPVGVALGFSVIVIGIFGEAAIAVRRSL